MQPTTHSMGLLWTPASQPAMMVYVGNLATAGLTTMMEVDCTPKSAGFACIRDSACITTEYVLVGV